MSWSGSDGKAASPPIRSMFRPRRSFCALDDRHDSDLRHVQRPAWPHLRLQFHGRRLFRQCRVPHGTADATIIVTATPWRNPANPLDVNASGAVTAIDGLVIINYHNAQNVTTLPATNPGGAPFLDVNGDKSDYRARCPVGDQLSELAIGRRQRNRIGQRNRKRRGRGHAIADSASTGPTRSGRAQQTRGAASDQQPAAAFTAEMSAVAVAASPLTDSLPTGTNPLTDPAAAPVPAGGRCGTACPSRFGERAPAAALSGMIGSGINALASDPTDDQPVSVFAANEQLAAATSSTGPSVPLGLAASGRLFAGHAFRRRFGARANSIARGGRCGLFGLERRRLLTPWREPGDTSRANMLVLVYLAPSVASGGSSTSWYQTFRRRGVKPSSRAPRISSSVR